MGWAKEFFSQQKQHASCGVAEQICHGEGGAEKDSEEGDIPHSEEGDEIEVLSNLHRGGEEENPQREKSDACREHDPHGGADQHRDQDIPAVGADEIVPHEQGDEDFRNQKNEERDGVAETFFHKSFRGKPFIVLFSPEGEAGTISNAEVSCLPHTPTNLLGSRKFWAGEVRFKLHPISFYVPINNKGKVDDKLKFFVINQY